uniref:Peptidase M16 C-terminal domain-containing protein n=1 Tax=Dunaliella tertiolecta TaxID=3047 RepID=A0A6S8MN13_DUNTE|mmetsp:Transcript_2779/g.7203  ORF Transcript_2779/g.7203 Transcript_2779/m.7203 type:complete len:585 (+) Transcript_2779:3305-5059(+)
MMLVNRALHPASKNGSNRCRRERKLECLRTQVSAESSNAGAKTSTLAPQAITAVATASLLLLPPDTALAGAPPLPLNPPDSAAYPSIASSKGTAMQTDDVLPAPPLLVQASSPQTITRASMLLPSDAEAESLPELPKSFPPLPAVQLPSYTEATLPNGLRLVLLEDHEVPIIRGSLLMRGGQYASPPDKVGLATLSLALQRGGGSVQFPGPTLDADLEGVAAAIETNAGQQAFVMSFSCPSENVSTVLRQFDTVLRSPALPAPRLEFYKAQVLDALQHQDDDADAQAFRKLRQLMYGKDSIYARQPSPETIASIKTDDVRNFLQEWERPDNSVLGVLGDFDTQLMLTELQEVLGGWQAAPGQPEKPPQVQLPTDPLAPASQLAGKVFLLDRPGATQASVFAAEPGVALDDPDATSLDVLGGMLSSFGGALFDQLRSREGLAYSVSGGWQSPPGHPGLFIAQAETSQPGALLKGLRRVLSASASQAPAMQDLAEAKEQRLNAFVFDFSSKRSSLVRTLIYDLLGLPRDQLLRYKEGLEAVQPSDILNAARAHLHPDQQVTVVIADAKAVRAELEEAGFDVVPLEV